MLQPLRTPQMLRNGHGCIANSEGRMLQGMTRMHEGWSSIRSMLRCRARSRSGGSARCTTPNRATKPCAHDAGRLLQGMRDAAQGGSAGTVLRARLRTSGRSEAPAGRRRAKKRAWRLPTLPRFRSTIGVRALDFRVRDGNGYFHSAMATKPTQTLEPDSSDAWSGCSGLNAGTRWTIWSSRSDD